MASRLCLSLLLPGVVVLAADFTYASFNATHGLAFNGHAATSACGAPGEYAYSARFGVNDATDDAAVPTLLSDTAGTTDAASRTTLTLQADADLTTRFLATFPHRDAAAVSPDDCGVRLRLTPARPSATSSVFRLEAAPVLAGFETGFTFQVTAHSRACTLVKDRAFGVRSHQSCSVHGGDGFAFVVHNDGAGSAALGGGGMGYGGLSNALAVEFDTWYNPEPAVADSIFDHVSIQASPPGGEGVVTMGADTRLGQLRRANIGDGLIHAVRIVYSPILRYDLLPFFSGSAALLDALKDGGEGRRLGTLVLYFDDMDTPLLAVPLNLNVLLRLPEDQAYVVRGGCGEHVVGAYEVIQRCWCDEKLTVCFFQLPCPLPPLARASPPPLAPPGRSTTC